MDRAVVLVLLLVLALGGAPVAAASGQPHVLPVAGVTVLRGFHEPDGPYGPGHRGLDLDVEVGALVRASADGIVGFAGRVVGVTWVSVDHGGGIRTTVGDLADVVVVRGDVVRAGDVLGRFAGSPHPDASGLHFSARRDGRHVDPRTLLAPPEPWIPTLVGPGGWEPHDQPDVPGWQEWDGETRWGFLRASPSATTAGWQDAPNPNHVVAVSGLGSSSAHPALDARLLGYDGSDVTQLSWAGRSGGPGSDPDDPQRDQRPYGPQHTEVGVDEGARLLDIQLRAQWARHPGQAVDLIGHSMGGVVIIQYLMTRHDPADPGLPPIGHVVTFASPHAGADLASAIRTASGDPVVDLLLGGIAHDLDTVAPGSRPITDLSVGSALTVANTEAFERAVADLYSGPLANGTRVLTLSGEVDVVAPDHRTGLPGAPHVMVPGGHTTMTDSQAAMQVLRAFLADQPVPGGGGGWGAWLAPSVGLSERALGVLLGGPIAAIRGGGDWARG